MFKKDSSGSQAGSGPVHYTEEWETYYKTIAHKLGIVSVDLGLASVAPLHYQYNCLTISLKLTNPLKNGLTSPQEENSIKTVEEQLIQRIRGDFDSTFVGRSTSTGSRHLYFFAGDLPNVKTSIKSVMQPYPMYQYSSDVIEDVDWVNYFEFLYPTEFQLRSIANQHKVAELEALGDDVSIPRLITHHLAFATEVKRHSFSVIIKEYGYHVVQQYKDAEKENSFLLEIAHTSAVDTGSVDQFVMVLIEVSARFSGEYLDWNTRAVQADS